MRKIPLVVFLATLTSCATQNNLDRLEEKVDKLRLDLTNVSNKTDNLVAGSVQLNTDIAVLKNDSTHLNEDVNITKHVIVDINKNLQNINRKTDAISKKLFPQKSKNLKKAKKAQ